MLAPEGPADSEPASAIPLRSEASDSSKAGIVGVLAFVFCGALALAVSILFEAGAVTLILMLILEVLLFRRVSKS